MKPHKDGRLCLSKPLLRKFADACGLKKLPDSVYVKIHSNGGKIRWQPFPGARIYDLSVRGRVLFGSYAPNRDFKVNIKNGELRIRSSVSFVRRPNLNYLAFGSKLLIWMRTQGLSSVTTGDICRQFSVSGSQARKTCMTLVKERVFQRRGKAGRGIHFALVNPKKAEKEQAMQIPSTQDCNGITARTYAKWIRTFWPLPPGVFVAAHAGHRPPSGRWRKPIFKVKLRWSVTADGPKGPRIKPDGSRVRPGERTPRCKTVKEAYLLAYQFLGKTPDPEALPPDFPLLTPDLLQASEAKVSSPKPLAEANLLVERANNLLSVLLGSVNNFNHLLLQLQHYHAVLTDLKLDPPTTTVIECALNCGEPIERFQRSLTAACQEAGVRIRFGSAGRGT